MSFFLAELFVCCVWSGFTHASRSIAVPHRSDYFEEKMREKPEEDEGRKTEASSQPYQAWYALGGGGESCFPRSGRRTKSANLKRLSGKTGKEKDTEEKEEKMEKMKKSSYS